MQPNKMMKSKLGHDTSGQAANNESERNNHEGVKLLRVETPGCATAASLQMLRSTYENVGMIVCSHAGPTSP